MTEQELRNQFSAHLRQELDQRDWTSGDLIRRLYSHSGIAVSRSTLWNWTTGKQIPRPFLIQKIAECFGQNLSDFFEP